jgi:hypothetical protein
MRRWDYKSHAKASVRLIINTNLLLALTLDLRCIYLSIYLDKNMFIRVRRGNNVSVF